MGVILKNSFADLSPDPEAEEWARIGFVAIIIAVEQPDLDDESDVVRALWRHKVPVTEYADILPQAISRARMNLEEVSL